MSFITTAVSAMVKFIPPKIKAVLSFPCSSSTVVAVVKGLPPTMSARTKTESSSVKWEIAWRKSWAKSSTDLPSFSPTAITWSILSPANIASELFRPSASPPWLTNTRYFILSPPLWWPYCIVFESVLLLSFVTKKSWHLSIKKWHLSLDRCLVALSETSPEAFPQ